VRTPDFSHSSDHAAAEPLATTLGCNQDLQRAEHVRRRSIVREASLDDCVHSSVRQTLDLAVPRRGNRVPSTDDLLELIVPDIKLKLGVLGDHPVEESLE
jgi:hypothetical protein